MTASRRRRVRFAGAALTVAALAGPALAGCSELPGSGSTNYRVGNGQVAEVAAAKRGEPVAIDGTTLEGTKLDIADFRGDIVVINIWGAWCPPCREEAPDLVAVAQQYADAPVHFVGINVREASPDNARAYQRTYDVPYPSFDDQGGEALLALRSEVPPTATPSTLVLDRQGRVAARILGPVPSRRTLTTLIDEAVAERG